MKLSDGRLVNAEVKDARNLVYYEGSAEIYAVLDGHVVLEPSLFTVANDTVMLKRPPAFDLKFLVAA